MAFGSFLSCMKQSSFVAFSQRWQGPFVLFLSIAFFFIIIRSLEMEIIGIGAVANLLSTCDCFLFFYLVVSSLFN